MADETDATTASESDDSATTDGGAETVEQTSTKGADEAFCSSCGETIKKDAELCPHCGVRQNAGGAAGGAQLKNPGIAAVASFFWSGLGQIYNGQIGKGLVLMVVQAINVALMAVVVGFVTYPLVWIYGMYDAYKTAEKINNGEVQV